MLHLLQVQSPAAVTAIISACVTLLVALLGIFGNWYIANQNRKKELLIKSKEIEQKEYQFLLENLKSFWEHQGRLYSEALKVVTKLTFIDDTRSEEFLAANARFLELCYGELPTCESDEVEEAMADILKAIDEKQQLDATDKAGLKDMKNKMQGLLLRLSIAVRLSSMLVEYSEQLRQKIRNNSPAA